MKFSLMAMTTVAGIALGGAIASPAQASPNKYFCAQLNGDYHVFERRDRGSFKMLSFIGNVPSSWDKRERCIIVSQRFQRFSDNGMLRYIGAGKVNSQPVLCAIASKFSNCDNTNVLVTLPPQSNPVDTVRNLMDLRALRTTGGYVSGDKKIENYENGKVSYDLEAYKEKILTGANDQFLIQTELTPLQ